MRKLRIGIVTLILAYMAGGGLAIADAPPAPTPAGSTLDQRVTQRKAERNIVLGKDDQQRLIGTCASAQTKLRSIGTKEVPVLQKRTDVYKDIDADLWIAIGQLKLADQDTFNIEKQRGELADKVAAYEVLASNYKQSLDDILLINCKADPVAFKAMLNTIRLYNDQIRAQLTSNREYVINTVKPTLKDFVATLKSKNESN